MSARILRVAASALLLGAAGLALALPAQAAVRSSVGKPLQEAQQLAAQGNYKAAMAKVNEAAAVSGKSAEESKDVEQMKNYIAVKSGDASIGGALGAKAKFANDFAAGKFKDVIADGELLRKNGALDGNAQLVIAQAYYRLHDNAGCIGYIKRNLSGGGEDALTLLQRCAYDFGDDATQRQALEQLVARFGKPEQWKNLLKLSERAKGLKDHDSLDIYRLKLMTGTMDNGDDYSTLAKLALQLHFPAEAQAAVQKGIDSKTLNADDRTNRLLNLAKGQAGADAAAQPKALAAAMAGNNGDALVTIGEDQIGQGKAKDAVDTIKAGLGKNLKDPNNAQLRLGTAYLAAGQKADAIKAFSAVKGDDNVQMIAHLYSLYARR